MLLGAPLFMGFPRQDYGVACRLLFRGDLPEPGTELSPPALAGRIFTTEPPGKPKLTMNSNLVQKTSGCSLLYSFLYFV